MPVPVLVWLGGAIAALGAAYLVYTHWDQVLDWLREYIPAVTPLIRKAASQLGPKWEWVAIAAADMLDELHAKISHKLYHKLANGNWLSEATETREIPTDELPPSVLKKLRQKRENADITEEIEDEIGMEISA